MQLFTAVDSSTLELTFLDCFSFDCRKMFSRVFSVSRLPVQRMPMSVLVRKGKDKMISVPKTEIVAKKKNLKQSPLRMKFLVMLIRDRWVPDALAQMKFSPKHRAADVAQIINVSDCCML